MRDHVNNLTEPEANVFLIRLWNELTIAGRCIWIDETVDQATQLNALKWLNEIQHRVWGAHSRNDDARMLWLLDRIISHCEQAPILELHVRVALDRSLAAVNASAAGAEPN